VIGNIYAMAEAFETLPDAYRTDFIENEIKIRRAYWDAISARDVDPLIHRTNVRALGWFKRENYDWKAMLRKGKFTVDPTPFFGMLTNGRENLKKMKAAGVIIGCGTDSGVPMNYHGTLYREMEFLARLGFSNLEVLQAATLINAKILCLEDQIGALEPGKAADIVVLNTNPLTDITAYRRPLMVFKDGRLQAQDDAAAPTKPHHALN
jgi:imidazolonepropionase-like amidohydrolase